MKAIGIGILATGSGGNKDVAGARIGPQLTAGDTSALTDEFVPRARIPGRLQIDLNAGRRAVSEFLIVENLKRKVTKQ